MTGRLEQLRASLAAVRSRIAAASERARRDPDTVRLLAVTKNFPATDVAALIDLGLADFAESRDQHARTKVDEVAALRPDARVRWHMVGRLQRNKARTVVRWADVVQSVDSMRLADALATAVRESRERGDRDAALEVFVQVSLDGDPARGGCPVEDVPQLTAHLARSGELSVRGLMAIAPLTGVRNAAFARLADLHRRLKVSYPNLVELSAGMSDDLEDAIAHGSTCVRVGTALLGATELASPHEGGTCRQA